MALPKAIGIDLGTTNSAAAWVDETGHTSMVPNLEGEVLTPSLVLFEDAELVVGKDARNAALTDPDRVAAWVKRDMGAPVYHRPIRGEYLPPEVIQSCILRKVRSDVIRRLGADLQTVITVPAYFDEPRRKATVDAGEMAGLQILDIVNEPTAAALAFGEALGYLTPQSAPRDPMTLLVYDLGGGTFDVTLLRLSPGRVETLATDGDVQLGGYDWDLRIVNYVADAFQRAHGSDPRQDPRALSRLYEAAVEAKHALSARQQVPIRVDYAGRVFEMQFHRQQFEELSADLLERTAYTTRQLMAAARMPWSQVSRILLVGGSTRMAAVSRMLQEQTGLRPDHSVNPDEAVARGAALYAHYLLGKRGAAPVGPSFEVTNVNSHSLGVEGIDPATYRKTNVILIPRNSCLPTKVTERFATKSENQRSIVIQVLEGESTVPTECTPIGRTVIRQLPEGLPRGWPIEVTFEYGINGRLGIRAVVPGTHREVALELERDQGFSRAGISRWKQAMAQGGGFQQLEDLLMEILGPPTSGQLPMGPAGRPAMPATPVSASPAAPAPSAGGGYPGAAAGGPAAAVPPSMSGGQAVWPAAMATPPQAAPQTAGGFAPGTPFYGGSGGPTYATPPREAPSYGAPGQAMPPHGAGSYGEPGGTPYATPPAHGGPGGLPYGAPAQQASPYGEAGGASHEYGPPHAPYPAPGFGQPGGVPHGTPPYGDAGASPYAGPGPSPYATPGATPYAAPGAAPYGAPAYGEPGSAPYPAMPQGTPSYGQPGGSPQAYGQPGGLPHAYGQPGGSPYPAMPHGTPSYGEPGGSPQTYGQPGGLPHGYGPPGGSPYPATPQGTPSYGQPAGSPQAYGEPGGSPYASPATAATTFEAGPQSYAYPTPQAIQRVGKKVSGAQMFVRIAGHIIAGLLGLTAGYLVLHLLRPEQFPKFW